MRKIFGCHEPKNEPMIASAFQVKCLRALAAETRDSELNKSLIEIEMLESRAEILLPRQY